MAVELHLPDLPEVPLSLGATRGAPPRAPTPWHLRVRDALSAYLPLLLMALLALGTWWLVKNTPQVAGPAPPVTARSDPDYTMTGFAIERFDAQGRLRVRVEGERLRHYPDTDRFEVDAARIRSVSQAGQVTRATARRALANADLSELQLVGGAEVLSDTRDGQVLQLRSEFLHAYLVTEQLRTHLPVQVQQGESRLVAAGMAYDNATRRLDLKGPVKANLAVGARAAP